ncbi:hypothetical protein UPYG_G00242930 [Umbra pygmaea]|uniref:Uncharacterized protein n=1 Tax=Umbra pygmaea TaxID=75934 RepID=A0ABD0WFP5_UMBPY
MRNPNKRAFGVHRFYDKNNLLPDEGYPFYKVGNLGAEGADDLPNYVTKYNTGHNDDSNIDRIIFSLKPGKVLDKIYVTQHNPHRGSYDPQHTYRISKADCGHLQKKRVDQIKEKELIVTMKTLNEMTHLQESGFGRPQPRHGLHLLHWFSNEYVTFTNNKELLAVCNPDEGGFGCHRFYGYDNLLPDEGFPFYEVGNLGEEGADDLPDDVTQYRTEHEDDSNIDRIIFSLKPGNVLDKIYVTKHDHHRGSFDPEHTYRISKGLITVIGNLELDDFLEQAGYS